MADAAGDFDITAWDEEVYDAAGAASLTRVHTEKAFRGDLAATSSAELLIVQVAGGGAAYVGLERVSGTLAGGEGTFVLHHDATSWSGVTVAVATVVPGSGTGGLEGLEGRMEISRHDDGTHTWTLVYSI